VHTKRSLLFHVLHQSLLKDFSHPFLDKFTVDASFNIFLVVSTYLAHKKMLIFFLSCQFLAVDIRLL
jgi:hypothetical protein